MASAADVIVDLGIKTAQSGLKKALNNASAYYDTHFKLLKDAYEAFKKDKELKSKISKIKASATEVKRQAARLKVEIPNHPSPPKKDAKSWGKKKKFTDFKEAKEAFVEGASYIIVTLDDFMKKADDSKKQIDKTIKDLQTALTSTQKKKGAWAKLQNVSNQHALGDLLTSQSGLISQIDKGVADLKKLRDEYQKAMFAAMKMKA
ncbi:MAG: hypothetical protein AAGF13_00550 [Pseudomonadota bacterium]